MANARVIPQSLDALWEVLVEALENENIRRGRQSSIFSPAGSERFLAPTRSTAPTRPAAAIPSRRILTEVPTSATATASCTVPRFGG